MSNPQPTARTVFIETVGCQMNVLDSELVAAQLRQVGYVVTDDWRAADVILFNTCSVRQHAEDKIYSRLGRLRGRKQRHPDLVIGVLGCMAQKDGKTIFRRAPHVDLICGPGQLAGLADMIEAVHAAGPNHRPAVALSLPRRDAPRAEVLNSFDAYNPARDPSMRPEPFQAFVRVMSGCDKFCSYCVVPGVRGPEQSRDPKPIVDEVRRLADQGVIEVTLLGQTVNGYRHTTGDGRRWRLSDVLAEVDQVAGIRRVKFVTNFPRHMTDDLLDAVRDLPKVCPYLHVPVQSGSDRVLKAMKRGYTAGFYREMLGRVRERLPKAAVSSDFIVGFPGETAADLDLTAELVAEARFKQIFVFKYSPRPLTTALDLDDDVPLAEKKRRNQVLLDLQEGISQEENDRFEGRTLDVLVTGRSKLSEHRGQQGPCIQLTGRAATDHIVVFTGPAEWIGRIVPVSITGASPLVLFAEACAPEPTDAA